MADSEWEEQPGRGGRSIAVTMVLALIVVIVAGVLVRPDADAPTQPSVLPTTQPTAPPARAGPTPTAQTEAEQPPEDGSVVVVDPESGAAVEVQSFEPARRWQRMPAAPFEGAARGPASWDGSRMLVWPGRGSGGAYDPVQDVWSAVPPAPIERIRGWSATWAGEEMIVWGGETADGELPADGAAFDPRAHRWRHTAQAPIAGRTGHASVWTGQGLLVWGGRDSEGNLLADGALYRPEAEAWEMLPPAPLAPRTGASVAWLEDPGSVLVWGGLDGDEEQRHGGSLTDGAVYRPGEGWRAIAPAPVPMRMRAATVYTGAVRCPADGACAKFLIWGRAAAGLHERDGYAYDVHTDTWVRLPLLLNQTRSDATALWTGTHAVVWGGMDWRGEHRRMDGYAYDPATERWLQIPARPGDPGADPSVLWTGDELIVWSGADEGWRYPLAEHLADD